MWQQWWSTNEHPIERSQELVELCCGRSMFSNTMHTSPFYFRLCNHSGWGQSCRTAAQSAPTRQWCWCSVQAASLICVTRVYSIERYSSYRTRIACGISDRKMNHGGNQRPAPAPVFAQSRKICACGRPGREWAGAGGVWDVAASASLLALFARRRRSTLRRVLPRGAELGGLPKASRSPMSMVLPKTPMAIWGGERELLWHETTSVWRNRWDGCQ